MRIIKDKPWAGSPSNVPEFTRLYERDRDKRIMDPFWATNQAGSTVTKSLDNGVN